MSERVWPAVAVAAAVGVQVGAATVASRWVVGEVGPVTLALLRYAIGAGCLLPFFLALPRVRFRGRDLVAVCLLGLGQFGILVVLLNLGLLTVTSARAALLFATFPLMTILLAAVLGRAAHPRQEPRCRALLRRRRARLARQAGRGRGRVRAV